MKLKMALLMAAVVLPGLSIANEDTEQSSAAYELNEILVTGEQPGPGMWKVSKGDHTLWILATYAPLPKKMTWRSAQALDRIATAQEIIGTGGLMVGVDSDAGFIEKFKGGWEFGKFKRNPNGAKLVDIVPRDLYAQWKQLKTKYLGRDRSVEKLRPAFAAQALELAAMKRLGLDDRKVSIVASVLDSEAAKHGLKFSSPGYKITWHIHEPAALMKKLAATPMNDLDCFEKTINELEDALQLMRLRANAWATGDIEALVELNQKPAQEHCAELLVTAMMAANDASNALQRKTTMDEYLREREIGTIQVRTRWTAAAVAALEKNEVTFALAPIDELVRSDGRLALLREKGYRVEAPESN